MPVDEMPGVSHGALPLPSGRLLAPAVLLPPGRLGERNIASISDDGGETWTCRGPVTPARHMPAHLLTLQDRSILENQIPARLPLDPGKEIPTRADMTSPVTGSHWAN